MTTGYGRVDVPSYISADDVDPASGRPPGDGVNRQSEI